MFFQKCVNVLVFSVSRWFMLPQTFSRLKTVFTEGWMLLHCGAVWLFVFVFFRFCWFVWKSARSES